MVVLVVAANTRVTGNPSIKMDQVMLQPHPSLHEFRRRGQSLVFMMIRKSSVNIVLHMDHSLVHNSIGNVAKAALPTEIIMVGQHVRMMIATTGHLVDHLTHDTIRVTSRSLIEVMATPEDIISQRVTVSLNQNGCSLDQAVELNLWSLVEKMKLRR